MSPKAVRRAASRIVRPFGALIDLVFPPCCSICNNLLDVPDEAVCPACAFAFDEITAPVCDRCGQPQPADTECFACKCQPLPLRAIRSAYAFGGPIQEAVLALKLQGRRELADYLGERLAVAQLPGWRWRNVDVLTPVPLHRRRRTERGFNQALLLAAILAKRLRIRLEPFGLRRLRQTASQSKMPSRAERTANVHQAFDVTKPKAIAGQHVCLVDDVITTGATLSACAEALLAVGAKSICAVTVARTLQA